MGREISLYPKLASRHNLKKHLEKLGFEKCWQDKNEDGYFWFNTEDFKSSDGVYAWISCLPEKELKTTPNKHTLHTHTRVAASWHDVKMQNDVLKEAKKLFGGVIKGDYGTNRYASLWEDTSTPISRGLKKIYNRVIQEIGAINHSLPDSQYEHPMFKMYHDNKEDDFIKYILSTDRSHIIYNGLVPFALAMLEHFFSETFKLLVTYDSAAKNKKDVYEEKVNFKDLLEVSKKNKTVEDIIARKYSFQNIDDINKAYKFWLDIDVKKILYKKKMIRNKLAFLAEKMSKIIDHRHEIIHRFKIDRDFDKDSCLSVFEAVEKIIYEFVLFLEKKYKFKLNINDIIYAVPWTK